MGTSISSNNNLWNNFNQSQETDEISKEISEGLQETNKSVNDLLAFSDSKMIQEILNLDINENPNSRTARIYKLMSRILKPLIKEAVEDIYVWREETRKPWEYTTYWLKQSVTKDKLNVNKSLVKAYFEKENRVDENSIPYLDRNWDKIPLLNEDWNEIVYLDENWKPVLNDYFYWKLDEYYQMYETIIIKRIQRDIKLKYSEGNKDSFTKDEFRNIEVNVINEFLYIIYAFGDKLNINEFENLFIKETVIEHDNSNDKHNRADVEWVVWMTWWIIKIYDSLEWNEDLLDMYKSFITTWIVTENWVTWYDFTKLAKNIDKHFNDSLIDIADIYKHWYYSEHSSFDDLEKIRNLIDKFMNNISVLKEKDLAFSNLNISSIWDEILKQKYGIWESIHSTLKTKHELESFVQLINYLNNEDLRHLTSDEYKKLKYDRLAELHSNITAEKAFDAWDLNFIDISNIELEDLDYDTYNKAGPDNRKKYFLEKLYKLDENNNIIWNNFSQIHDNWWVVDDFCKYYSKKNPGLKSNIDDVRITLTTALEIVNWETPINVIDFEKNDIALEQILVSWFRYNLILASSKQSDNKVDVVSKLHEKLFWPKEKIKFLADDQLISGSNIEFISWDLKNSSIWDIDELINNWEQRFRKRPIDLNSHEHYWYRKVTDENITEIAIKNTPKYKSLMLELEDNSQLLTQWMISVEQFSEKMKSIQNQLAELSKFNKKNNVLFKDISSLYIPNIKEWLDINDYKNHISLFLELTNLLLQRKEIDKNKFSHQIEILNNNWIPLDDFETIHKLKKFLKYTWYILPLANELHTKSIKDFKAIKSFKRALKKWMIDNNTDWIQDFEIGKPKTLNRIFEKIISSYSWDIREMWDLVRMRYIASDLEDSYNKLIKLITIIKKNHRLNHLIVQWIVEDNIWNNSERGTKETQYRDLKIQLKTNEWNLIEVQFIVKNVFDWKEEWLREWELLEMYKHKNIELDQDFITELENRATAEWIYIPVFFLDLAHESVTFDYDKYNLYDKLNSDVLYKLWRWTSNKKFKKVIKYLESVVYDQKRWEIISEQTKQFLKEIKIKKDKN